MEYFTVITDTVLCFYLNHKNWIELIKDAVFLSGAFALFRWLWKRRLNETSDQIRKNLEFRERIEPHLDKYVRDKASNDVKDIGIRFIHWKNYPWNVSDDAYKFCLRVNYFESKPHFGWIDNTGISFEEPLWWFESSVYEGEKGIFFIDRKGLKIKGFEEYSDAVILTKLPFAHIVDFDFKEYVEYEPIFYIRYPYNKWKKLYEDDLILRERPHVDETHYLRRQLKQSRRLKRYSWVGYNMMKLKLSTYELFSSNNYNISKKS